jgi:hypothetical protein
MGMFAGISEVNVYEKTRYVEPGNYIVEINKVKSGKKQSNGKEFFCAELEIVESDNPEFTPGDTMTWMKMVHEWRKYWLQDVKGFVSMATEASPEDVTEEVCEFVAGEEQPLVGKRLKLRAYMQEKTKKDGSTVSYCEEAFTLIG